jgi:hypothetical protein
VSSPPVDPTALPPGAGATTPMAQNAKEGKTAHALVSIARRLKKPWQVFLYLVATIALVSVFVLSTLNVLVIRGEDPFLLGKELARSVPEIPSVLWQLILEAGNRLADPMSFRSQEAKPASDVRTENSSTRRSKISKKSASPKAAPKPETPARAVAEHPPAPVITPAQRVEPELDKIPRDLDKTADMLIKSKQAKARLKAANKILSHRPASQVPKFLLALARLRKAQTCPAQQEIIRQLSDLGDPRALPVLRQLSAQKRTGCGPQKKHDCLGCLRDELALTIEKLESR